MSRSLVSIVQEALRYGRPVGMGSNDEALTAIGDVRSLLIEADAFISHMVYRGSWPGDRRAVDDLISKLRREGTPLPGSGESE